MIRCISILFAIALLLSGTGVTEAQEDLAYSLEVMADIQDSRLMRGDSCVIVDDDTKLIRVGVYGEQDIYSLDVQASGSGIVVDVQGKLKCNVEVAGAIEASAVPSRVEISFSSDIGSAPFVVRVTKDTLNDLAIDLGTRTESLPASPYIGQRSPIIPSVTSAMEVSAGPTDWLTNDNEPNAVTVREYVFQDAESASAEFDHLLQWTVERWTEGVLIEDSLFREVSIGRIGEKRTGMLDEEFGGISVLIATVQQGNRIATIEISGYEADIPAFAGPFLQEVIQPRVDLGEPLLPELSDFPVGWEYSFGDGPRDVTRQVQTGPLVPAASPEASPAGS